MTTLEDRKDSDAGPGPEGSHDSLGGFHSDGGETGADVESPGPLPVRLFQVFVSPGRLFATLRNEPRWAAAAVLGAALVVLSTLVVPGEIWDEMFRRQMLQSGQEMPEGVDFGTIQRVIAVAAGGIFWFVWLFVVAGIITGVFAFLMGDQGRFKQYLSVTAHALLIPALGGLAVVPLRIIRRDPQLTLNLGLFADLEPGYLANFLATQDLLLLWAYVVMALGVHVIDRRRSWGSAAAILIFFTLILSAGMAFLLPG